MAQLWPQPSSCPRRPHRSQHHQASSGNDAVTEKLRIELGQHHQSLLALTIPQALDWAAATWSGKVALSFVHASDVLTYRQLAESVARLRTGLAVSYTHLTLPTTPYV